MWQLSHNCLLTSEFLFKRKVINNCCCALCDAELESANHLFLQCPRFVLLRHRLPTLELEDIQNFVVLLYHCDNQPAMKNCISTIFWLMWRARSEFIFKNKEINQDVLWNQRHSFNIRINKANKITLIVHLKWEPPPVGWFKVNIDGASIKILEWRVSEPLFEITRENSWRHLQKTSVLPRIIQLKFGHYTRV